MDENSSDLIFVLKVTTFGFLAGFCIASIGNHITIKMLAVTLIVYDLLPAMGYRFQIDLVDTLKHHAHAEINYLKWHVKKNPICFIGGCLLAISLSYLKDPNATSVTSGLISGIFTGFVTEQLPRTSTFLMGLVIILFEVLEVFSREYILISMMVLPIFAFFDVLGTFLKTSTQSNIDFTKCNPTFSVSFLGGFLIGMTIEDTFNKLGVFDDDSRPKQTHVILQGSITGFLGGYVVKSISGALAIIVGSTILIYELASHAKNSNAEAHNELTQIMDDFCGFLSLLPGTKLVSGGLKYARSNTSYFASFIGGFLIGFGVPDLAKKSPLAVSFNAQLLLDCREVIGAGDLN